MAQYCHKPDDRSARCIGTMIIAEPYNKYNTGSHTRRIDGTFCYLIQYRHITT